MLQAEGLVDATPNRGATVRVHDAEDLDDLYQLRALLEGHAARRAAARITDGELDALRESCDRFEALSPRTTCASSCARTSSSTARSSRSPAARAWPSMVRQVIELPLVYKSYIWYSPDQKRISVALPPADRQRARDRVTPSAPSW